MQTAVGTAKNAILTVRMVMLVYILHAVALRVAAETNAVAFGVEVATTGATFVTGWAMAA